jgi:glycosyltransferase involved in cell wall biosynthesis
MRFAVKFQAPADKCGAGTKFQLESLALWARDWENGMKIAQVAPLTEAVPPRLYGGTERVVSWLTEELVELGHDVTLFASGDSVTSANLVSLWPRALRLDGTVRDPNALHIDLIEQVYRRAHEFDIIHCHIDYYPFSLLSRQPTPFVTTLHGRLDLPEHQPVFTTFSHVPVISISDAQRSPLPQANWAATVHHGMPESLLRPLGGKPSYLAFLGRVSPEKGLDRAIAIARMCHLPLKIAAKVDKADAEFFEHTIRPLLDSPQIEFVGEIDDARKPEFLSGAVALLTPIDWPEPFGLVMIEAMACGTPVVAFKRGSAPEIVENGVTGYTVEDVTSAAAAVNSAVNLPRDRIRQRFEERFSSRRMAKDYLEAYRALIFGQRGRAKLTVV